MISIALLTALAVVLPILPHIHVYAITPPALQEFAFSRAGSNFYVQSGVVRVNNTLTLSSTTLYALDLSISWSTSSAPWKSLGTGPTPQAYAGAVYGNNQTFVSIAFTPNPSLCTFSPYNIKTGTWGTSLAVTNTTVSDILQFGIMSVADPTTGLLYIPGGANMNILDLNTFTWKPAAGIPAGMMTSRNWGSAVYNPIRKTIMYTGGYDYTVGTINFDPTFIVSEYTVSTGGWSTLSTSSVGAPTPKANHCTAVSEDGSTLVIFGGRLTVSSPGTFTSVINILDIASGAWTAGPAYKTNLVNAGCVIVGTQFLVWGGSPNGIDTTSDTAPLIFDMTAKTWTTSYTAPAYYQSTTATSTGSTPSSTDSTGTKSSGSGTTIGIIAGVVVIALVTAFEVFRRRRVRRKERIENGKHDRLSKQKFVSPEPEMSNNGSGGGGGGDASNDNISGQQDMYNPDYSLKVNNSYGYHDQNPTEQYSPYFSPNTGYISSSTIQPPSIVVSKADFEMNHLSKSDVSFTPPPPAWGTGGSSPAGKNRSPQALPQSGDNGYYGKVPAEDPDYPSLIDKSPRLNHPHEVIQTGPSGPQYGGYS